MDTLDVITILRDGIKVLLIVSAPMMITALVIGLVVSLVQALTQIQEQTLSFVPKVTSMLFVMMLALPFMIQTLQDYTNDLFTRIENIESAGHNE